MRMAKEQAVITWTKTKRGRYTFISSEAVSAVWEWIKIRLSYIQAVQKKATNLNNVRLPNGMGITHYNASAVWIFKKHYTSVYGPSCV